MWYVAELIPCLRQTSLAGNPASASFRISTIWLSLNRDRFIRTSRPNPARKFYSSPVTPKGKLTVSRLFIRVLLVRDTLECYKAGSSFLFTSSDAIFRCR